MASHIKHSSIYICVIVLFTIVNCKCSGHHKKPGWFYSQLITITFCALSIEAIGNAFGKRFVERWSDFESSSPIAKLRILCEHLNIEVNFDEEPWSSAVWLVRLRNKIAHAKPQIINVNIVMSRDEYDKKRGEEPKSKIEDQISLDNAIKAFEVVERIKNILCDNIPAEEQLGLRSDAWHGSASVLNDD